MAFADDLEYPLEIVSTSTDQEIAWRDNVFVKRSVSG